MILEGNKRNSKHRAALAISCEQNESARPKWMEAGDLSRSKSRSIFCRLSFHRARFERKNHFLQ